MNGYFNLLRQEHLTNYLPEWLICQKKLLSEKNEWAPGANLGNMLYRPFATICKVRSQFVRVLHAKHSPSRSDSDKSITSVLVGNQGDQTISDFIDPGLQYLLFDTSNFKRQ